MAKQPVVPELQALRERRKKIAQTLDAGIEALEQEMVATASAITEKRQEIKELESKQRSLRQQAQRYTEGAAYFDPELVRTLPARRSKTGRTRMDIKGSVLDTSRLASTINYRFMGDGEVVIGHLDKRAARSWNGKRWPEDRPTGELIDELYQTEDGQGFFTVLSKRGVKLNPLAIFTKKAQGHVARTPVNAH